MKASLIAIALCTLPLTAQQYPAGQLKHLSIPTLTSVRPVSAAALEIEREPQFPSIIHLKGKVEIRTPVCVVVPAKNAHMCGGYVVVRADEADLHEDSGQIDPRGSVTVTREP